MIHRHLDHPVEAPLADRGDAALDDLLDRGDLADWRPLLAAIVADPFGDVADRVLRLCDASPRYGTSPLLRAWIARRRAFAEGEQAGRREAARLPDRSLAEIRQRSGLSQRALAERIGMSQSDLSKAERRSDWKVSTVMAIVMGLGLRARIVVEDADGRGVDRVKVGGNDEG